MNDLKRIFIVLILVGVSIGTYYYSDTLTQGITSLSQGNMPRLSDNTNSNDSNTLASDSVKTVVVEEESAVINVVEKSKPAVVSILEKSIDFDLFDGPISEENSIGTGFLIDGNEWIVLTNKHVVSDPDATYSVILNDKETYSVDKVYSDPINDFAILVLDKTDQDTKKLPELPLGDSDKIKVGQTVVAIGNALGEFNGSVTKGVISGVERGIVAGGLRGGAGESLENVIQTDAALNPGNSGGPLLNLNGEVIGINVAITRGAQNVGFALPINTLKTVIDQFKASGKISRPYLGVEYMQITKDLANERSIPVGAFVRSVVSDSPAEAAGLKVGDIILSINGTRLNDTDQTLAKVVAGLDIGSDVNILADRNGREVTVTAKLIDLSE